MNTPQLNRFELSFDKKGLIVYPDSTFLTEIEISFSDFIDWMIVNNKMEQTTKNDSNGFIVLYAARQFSGKSITETVELGETIDLVPCACRVHTYEAFYNYVFNTDISGLLIDGKPLNLISEFINDGDYVFEENEDYYIESAEDAYQDFRREQMI